MNLPKESEIYNKSLGIMEFIDDANIFQYIPSSTTWLSQYLTSLKVDKYYKASLITTEQYNKIKNYIDNDITFNIGKELFNKLIEK